MPGCPSGHSDKAVSAVKREQTWFDRQAQAVTAPFPHLIVGNAFMRQRGHAETAIGNAEGVLSSSRILAAISI